MQEHARRLTMPGAMLVAVLWSAPAAAQSGGPALAGGSSAAPAVTELRTQLGASINNLGVQQSLEWSRRKPLAPGAGPMRSEAHVQLGATASVSPSYARIGVWGQVAPLSILVVRAGVEPAFYFGTFDSLMSFDRRDTPFDTDTRKARGGATTGTVWRWYVTPTLRARLGSMVAAATADWERWSASVTGPLFYEPTRDTLLDKSGDSLIALRHVVMYEHVRASGATVSLGGIHTLQRVHGFKGAQLNQVQKLGVLFATQSDGRFAGLARPSLTVMVAHYLDDPSKEGGWTAAVAVSVSLHRR